ncbi:MAG: alpha/beta fold hydrolase [Actinomycetota bacterium]|nr:alpha/beta fold hydrolase [Actinomycetota bacterium]
MTPPLHAEVAGRADGVPAVLVHGFLSSNAQWDLNRERLGARLRLVQVELLGHGRSPAPDDPEAYAPDAVVERLDSVRELLGIDRWFVVGHSMGGAIGIRYALTHPDRVLGMVFTNSRAVFGVGRDPDEPPRIPADLRRLPQHPIHATRFPSDVQARMVAAADAMDPAVVERVVTHVGGWRSADELGRLAVPTLLVNGRWEKAFQPHVAVVRDTIDDVTIVELEGGHSINIEQPEHFDRAVLDFVAAAGPDR